MSDEINVQSGTVWVGDIWEDLDPRCNGRQLKVLAVESHFATVQHPSGNGNKRKIRLDRFRANSTGKRGYRLLQRNGIDVGSGSAPAAAA